MFEDHTCKAEHRRRTLPYILNIVKKGDDVDLGHEIHNLLNTKGAEPTPALIYGRGTALQDDIVRRGCFFG
jgi:hypothetical protein